MPHPLLVVRAPDMSRIEAVACIGPRPSSQRLGMKWAAKLLLGASIVMSGAYPLPGFNQGVGAEDRHDAPVLGSSGYEWVEVPHSPWISAMQGHPTLEKTENLLIQKNLSPEQAAQVAEDLFVNQAPLLLARGVAPETRELFEERMQNSAKELVKAWSQTPEEEGHQNLVLNFQTRYAARQGALKASLEKDQLDGFEASASTLEQAKKSIELAAQEAGLAGLRLPWGTWQSPSDLSKIAQGIRQANQELSMSTGWKGQVLGLHGRVILEIGSNATQGSASTFQDENGYIHIQSDFTSLSHEWFHALDYVLGRWEYSEDPSLLSNELTREAASSTTYSKKPILTDRWDRLINPDLTEEQRKKIIEEMEAVGSIFSDGKPLFQLLDRSRTRLQELSTGNSPWASFRMNTASLAHPREESAALYLKRPAEILAEAFATHLELQGVEALKKEATQVAGYTMPMEEAKYQAKGWTVFFNALSEWWHQDQMQRAPAFKRSPRLRS